MHCDTCGKCAGHLVHTNEVLLHLGDTTAVHVSAKHAQAVLKRRVAYVEEEAATLRRNLDALEARRDFAPGGSASEEVCTCRQIDFTPGFSHAR